METINHVTLLTSILAGQRCLKILGNVSYWPHRYQFYRIVFLFYPDSGDINGIFVGLTVVRTQTEKFVFIRHFQKVQCIASPCATSVHTGEGFVETLAWKHIDLDGSYIHNRDLVDFVLNWKHFVALFMCKRLYKQLLPW